MSNAEQGSAAMSSLVPFGKNVNIDPSKRLPQFDNGASLAYLAYDDRDRKQYIAIIAGVESLPRWNDVPLYKALIEKAFIRQIGSGALFWPLENKQKFVLLYEGNLGECLVKKGAYNTTTWRHPEMIEFLIQPVAQALRELRDRNLTHGSIRTTNIFHGAGSKDQQVVIGDCLSVQSLSTQPSLYLTIDKAQAEPMGRGSGSIADDVYAFGVTLALFLRKHNELEGLSESEILHKKIDIGSFATIVGNERFQASFLELLRGMLHDDALLRWTVDDIAAWLDGARLNLSPPPKKVKAARPFIFMGQSYIHPEALAVDIKKNANEAIAQVENGLLGQWITKSTTDEAFHERYEKMMTRIVSLGGTIAEHKDFVLAQLIMVLNPMLPIHYKGRNFTYDGLGAMLAIAAYQDRDLSFFQEVLRMNLLDHAMNLKGLSQNDLLVMLKQFDSCRSSLQQKKIGYGIERCVYILCKNAPCLSPKFKNFFVSGHNATLLAFESLCQSGGQIALLMDRHSIAFFLVWSANIIDKSMYDLGSSEKAQQIAGNLRFLAAVQQRSSGLPVPAIAGVLLDSLSDVYKNYKNKDIRKAVQAAVTAAARAGDLVKMSALLDDEKALKRDADEFHRAMYEYRVLENEFRRHRIMLKKKGSYGLAKGHDIAAIISWIIATIITLISVFAFISGYQIF